MTVAYLDAFPVLRSSDLDQARAAVADRYCDHRLELVRGRRLDVVHNHVRGARISVNLLRYGGDVRIDPGALDAFYLIQLPLAGAARVRHRQQEICASPTLGTLLNPDRPTRMEWGASCTKLMVQIDADYLNEIAAEEFGGPLPGPVRFDPRIDLAAPAGARIMALAAGLARSFERGVLTPERRDLGLLHGERQIVSQLLALQPSNVRHLLRPGAMASSAQLRRAIAFLRAHFAEDLTLAAIAEAAGAHPRSLQARFRHELGQSPMSYLRDLRLDMARYWLLQRVEPRTVTDVAYSCGYSHLGRFSGDYRSRFGQSPSRSAPEAALGGA